MATLDELAPKMLAACGRRCCVCRRFKPTQLQVHHIRLKSDGGTDEEENLIVLCVTCHIDVHSRVPFTRRFTEEELKCHRDTLIEMVANGVFPSVDESDDYYESLVAEILRQVASGPPQTYTNTQTLSPEAIEMLLALAQSKHGFFLLVKTDAGWIYNAGDKTFDGTQNPRAAAHYRHAIDQLRETRLLEKTDRDVLQLTYYGYLLADELLASKASN